MAELRYIGDQLSGEGLAGEISVITSLVNGLSDAYIVIPWVSVRKPSGRGRECDVLVIGPNGLFLIEVKDWHGHVRDEFGAPYWTVERPDEVTEQRKSPVEEIEQKRRILLGQLKQSRLSAANWIVLQDILTFPDHTKVGVRNRPPAHPQRGQPGLQIMSYAQVVPYIQEYSYQKVTLSNERRREVVDLFRSLPEPTVSSVIGAYKIMELRGAHDYVFGQCQVFKAKDSLGRLVRIKQYVFDPLLDRRKRQAQMNEIKRDAYATVELKGHPAIPIVYNDFVYGDRQCIVIEWIEGTTLFSHLQRQKGKLPGRAGIAWYTDLMADVCDVLAHVHAKSVIHRDIRPENILIPSDGRDSSIVLLNFDSAKIDKMDTISEGKPQIGLLAYTSPEQQHYPGGVDARTDLYAVGAVLYEALCNKTYGGQGAPGLRKLNPDVGVALGQVVRKSLAHDLDHRPASARELALLLREALTE